MENFDHQKTVDVTPRGVKGSPHPNATAGLLATGNPKPPVVKNEVKSRPNLDPGPLKDPPVPGGCTPAYRAGKRQVGLKAPGELSSPQGAQPAEREVKAPDWTAYDRSSDETVTVDMWQLFREVAHAKKQRALEEVRQKVADLATEDAEKPSIYDADYRQPTPAELDHRLRRIEALEEETRKTLSEADQVDIEDLEVLLGVEQAQLKVLIGAAVIPPLMIQGRYRGCESVDRVGFEGREVNDAWMRGHWRYMCVLSCGGSKLIIYRGKSSWGLKHTFDSATDLEQEDSGRRMLISLYLDGSNPLMLAAFLTVYPWVTDVREVIETYSVLLGDSVVSVTLSDKVKASTPEGDRPLVKFKEGGFNPWGSTQTSAQVYVELSSVGGEKVTVWNMYLPPTPSIASDSAIPFWSLFFRPGVDDTYFRLTVDQPPGSVLGCAYPGLVPTRPSDILQAPVVLLHNTHCPSPTLHTDDYTDLVLFWSSPKYPIRATGMLKGHTPLPPLKSSNKAYQPAIREGFNPYGNGQPGVYIIGAEVLGVMGIKTDYQGGVYLRCAYQSFDYLPELHKLAVLSPGEAIGASLVAHTHGHLPRVKNQKEEPPGKGGKGQGGYRREGLNFKKYDKRMERLLELYETDSALALAYLKGVITWSTFKEISQYHDKSNLDHAFLKACAESDEKGMTVLASRKDLKVRDLWVKKDNLISELKKFDFCREYGLPDEEYLAMKDLHYPSDSDLESTLGDEETTEKSELADESTDSAEPEAPAKTEPEPKVTAVDNATVTTTQDAQKKSAPAIPPEVSAEVRLLKKEDAEALEVMILELESDHLSEFQQALLKHARTLEWDKATTETTKQHSASDVFTTIAADLFNRTIRPELVHWAGTMPKELWDNFSRKMAASYLTVEKLWTKQPGDIESIRNNFERFCRCHYVLTGLFDKEIVCSGLQPVQKEGLLTAPPFLKVIFTSCETKLQANYSLIDTIELWESNLVDQVPTKERSLIEAQLDRVQKEFAGSHTAVSTNCQIDTEPQIEVVEQPTTAAKDGTEYEPYPRVSDRYEPYPRLDEQYQPYPRAPDLPNPSSGHWSALIGNIFGANNYIGKGKTAGGKWTGHIFDYTVPALSTADKVARTHDMLLEVIPEPQATAAAKEIHGGHPIITALEWNNAITRFFTTIVFLVLFLEGGFNPYGNGQAEQGDDKNMLGPKRCRTATEVSEMLAKFLAGNWQMSVNLAQFNDFTAQASLSLDAQPYDHQLPLLTYSLEQTRYANKFHVTAQAAGYTPMLRNSFRNLVSLSERSPSDLDPLTYKVNPNFHESMMTGYAAPKTLREWAALVGQNQNYPNPLLTSSILGALYSRGSGFIHPFTKMFLALITASNLDTGALIPQVVRENHDIFNPPGGITDPTIVGQGEYYGPLNAAAAVYPTVMTATPRMLNDATRVVDANTCVMYTTWGYNGWGDFLADRTVAVVPVGEWNTRWSPGANSTWLMMFMEYPWSAIYYDILGGAAPARWSPTANLVHMRGPQTRILLVTAAQELRVRLQLVDTVAGTFSYVDLTVAEGILNGVPWVANANFSLWEWWAAVAAQDKRRYINEILRYPPPIVADSEIIAAMVNALTYAVRLAPDITNDTGLHQFSYTHIGANAAYEQDISPLPGMLLNGLLPRASLDILGGGAYPMTVIDGPTQAAISIFPPAEVIGRTLQVVAPDNFTNMLSRIPIANLSPIAYMFRVAYKQLLFAMDIHLKELDLPRMLAYGAWSGFAVMSNSRDHVKMEYLIHCAMAPAARASLIVVTNPPHTANHVAYVNANSDLWFPIGLYTGIDKVITKEKTYEKAQVKLDPSLWVGTVGGHVYYTGDKWKVLEELCMVWNMMNNAPTTNLAFMYKQDRGFVMVNPRSLQRGFSDLILNYTVAMNAPMNGAVLRWSALGGNRAQFAYKGYNQVIADLSQNINDMEEFLLSTSAINFNVFPQVLNSKAYTSSMTSEIPLVDAGSGISYNDSAIKRLRNIKVGDYGTVQTSAAKNLAGMAPTDGATKADLVLGAPNDYINFGGSTESQL